MPAPTTYTKPLTATQASKLKEVLKEEGFEFETKPYCLYAGTRPGVNVLVYEKGPKVVVQGKGTEDFVTLKLEPLVLEKAELGYEEVNHPEWFTSHIGVDESGKGDFFGPLVIAGVHLAKGAARRLMDAGVMDSKKISGDKRISTLANVIRDMPGVTMEVVSIGPEKYNQLYDKFRNLNRLLAWGHATVLENLLARVPDCKLAVSDQFANPAVLKRALKEKGRAIELVQRTKAESDPAVAAASIIARDRFVKWLDETGKRAGIELPKGVSESVKAAARAIVNVRGEAALSLVAKMHFRTAAEVLGRSIPVQEDQATQG